MAGAARALRSLTAKRSNNAHRTASQPIGRETGASRQRKACVACAEREAFEKYVGGEWTFAWKGQGG